VTGLPSPSATRALTAWSAGAWAIYLGWIVIVVDGGALNLALPTIAHEFGASPSGLEWVVNAYTLPLASLLLLSGGIGDRLGAVRLFRLSALGFALASVASALSPSLAALVTARAFQGAFAAGLLPMVLALITKTMHDPHQRAKAVNLMTVFGGAGLAVGPFLGGLLTQTVGWRAVFWLTVPLALGAVLLLRRIPETQRAAGVRVDVAGQITGSLALVALVGGMVEAGSRGWGSPLVVVLLVLGIGGLVAFIAVEKRAAAPMMPLELFRSRPFSAATVGGFGFQFGAYGLQFFLALFVQRAWGVSALSGGLLLLSFAAGIVGASTVINPLLVGRGPRALMMLGGVIAVAGALLLVGIGAPGSWPLLIVGNFLVGLGTGTYSTSLNHVASGSLGRDQAGIASGVYNTSRQIGQAVGIALLGALAAAPDLVTGVRVAGLISAGLALLIVVLALRYVPRRVPVAVPVAVAAGVDAVG
jgi:DHA2 family methylenomycin A resistance protein-like MFS transporter